MKNVIRKYIAVLVTALLFTSFSANASLYECEMLIEDLRAVIDETPVTRDDGFIGKNGGMDQTGLSTKASEALVKFRALKIENAMDKLGAIVAKVGDLNSEINKHNGRPAKQKLTDYYAIAITNSAADAMSCIAPPAP
jgi:hypothetical protein